MVRRTLIPPLPEALREEIRLSGMSANALSKVVDVKQQTISEFLRGKDIRAETAQKLIDYFQERTSGELVLAILGYEKSLRTLAKKAGMTDVELLRFLQGRLYIPSTAVARLRDVLGLKPAEQNILEQGAHQ